MPQAEPGKAPLWLVLFFLGLIIVIWGSTWLVIRIGNEYTDIFTGLALRFGIASTVLGALLLVFRIRVPLDKNAWLLYFLLWGCAFFLPYMLVYWAQRYIESALTSLLFSVFPIFVIAFAHFIIPGDRMNWIKVIGALVSLCGLVLLFVGKVQADPDPEKWNPEKYTTGLGALAMLAVIGSAFVQAFQTVIVKLRGKEIHPMALIFIPMLLAALTFAVITLFHEPEKKNVWVWQAWTCILILAVLGSVVTFGIYFYLVQVVEVSKLSLNAFITPLFSLFVGIVFGSEAISNLGWYGIPLAAGGVFLATRKWGVKKPEVPSTAGMGDACAGSLEVP
ncbi:MAG: DMT family transporter [Planctomycetota bacterium]|nr:MAG: DMT family transporter [Planctomycetota bacterium]